MIELEPEHGARRKALPARASRFRAFPAWRLDWLEVSVAYLVGSHEPVPNSPTAAIRSPEKVRSVRRRNGPSVASVLVVEGHIACRSALCASASLRGATGLRAAAGPARDVACAASNRSTAATTRRSRLVCSVAGGPTSTANQHEADEGEIHG